MIGLHVTRPKKKNKKPQSAPIIFIHKPRPFFSFLSFFTRTVSLFWFQCP